MASSSAAAGPSAGPRRSSRNTRKISEALPSEADNAPTTLSGPRLGESSRSLRPRKSQNVDHPSEGGLGDTVDAADRDSDDERVSLSDEEDEEEETEVDFTGTKTEPQQRKVVSKGKNRATSGSPKKRVWVAGSSVKTLVRAVDPNNGRCILTGMADPAIAIQLVHIIPHRTKASALRLLEYHWRIPHYSLNLDTEFNVALIMAAEHITMDAGAWTLVPHHADIDKIMTWIEKRKGEKAATDRESGIANLWKREPNTTELEKHTYFMLTLNDSLRKVPIYRLPLDREFDPMVPEERHVFPFTTLGPLISHIQPHFVVFAVGAKLATLEEKMGTRKFDKWLKKLGENASFGHNNPTAAKNIKSLRTIRTIYEMWIDDNLPEKEDIWYTKTKLSKYQL